MTNAGGVRNLSIRGSPYDFRHVPNFLKTYFDSSNRTLIFPEIRRYAPSSAYNGRWLDEMTRLVQETYEINGQKKVALLR